MNVAVGTIGAVLLWLFCLPHLGTYGLYYDEAHQVPASFSGVQESPDTFVVLKAMDIPLLNTSYIGVIKSHIYRGWMALTGRGFDPLSWRLLGILLAAAGLFLFCLVAGRRLTGEELAIFLFFVLTDATMILAVRHDWGPSALSLSFRLVFLALWLLQERSDRPARSLYFLMGALIGIAVFEKLSSFVLIIPLIIALVMPKQIGRLTRICWSGAGAIFGFMPLVAVNVLSYVRSGNLISLSEVTHQSRHFGTVSKGVMRFSYGYLSDGWGGLTREWIVGMDPGLAVGAVEALIWVICGMVALMLWRKGVRSAGALFLSFFCIGLALFLIPKRTFVHHWIVGTPFQYLGLALLLPRVRRFQTHPVAVKLLVLAVLVLAGLRIGSLVITEQALIRGGHSWRFDPEFTRLGQRMAASGEDTLFVSGTWGVGSQAICFSGGDTSRLIQPYRNQEDIDTLVELLRTTDKENLYLVWLPRASSLYPGSLEAIQKAIEDSPRWFEVRSNLEDLRLNEVRVRRFLRVPDKARAMTMSY
ncbi:MAG: glycosyltransferase family 39 protein [Verrucomicrobia bacterium]|nr:glycosyltransferase family 39 protein [Verrucomicrobiota bacterium]